MSLSQELIEFLKEYKNLINDNSLNSWATIYSDIFEEYYEDSTVPGEFTSMVINKLKLDPAKILSKIPRRFLRFQSQVTHYDIPNNCDSIGAFAFEDTSITSIDIPNSVNNIDYLAFAGTKLTSIKLPDSVKIVGNAAFLDCKNLKEVDLGRVVSLGDDVFQHCGELEKVIIPGTVNYVNINCFYGCKKLKEIIYKSTMKEWEYMQGDELEDWYRFKIICTDGVIEID